MHAFERMRVDAEINASIAINEKNPEDAIRWLKVCQEAFECGRLWTEEAKREFSRLEVANG